MINEFVDHVTGNTAVIASLVTLGIFYLVKFALGPRKPKFDAPRLLDERGKRDMTKLHSMVNNEFQKYRNKFFSVRESHGNVIIIPIKYIEELKALPNDTLSFEEETDELFQSDYSLMSSRATGGNSHTVIQSVKNGLTRSLGVLMGDIYDEMVYAFDTEMPPCDDWTAVNINDKLIRIVALVSGKIFIGNPMNRNEEYLKSIILFTLNCFQASNAIKDYPSWLRPIAQYWCREITTVKQSLKTMEHLMEPVIKENMPRVESGTAPGNMNTWNMTNSNATERRNLTVQAHYQLSISMAAIHTTSMTTTHAVFDLAAHPEYFEPLRKEAADIKATETTPYLSKTSMPKLKKLDSFMKESQRINPLSIISWRRKVMKDITLHDGNVLPVGTHIAVAGSAINFDPVLWEEPMKFNGFRFSDLREKPGQENRHQFVTTSIDSLNFGHGVHACPGRFFANNEIKLVFTYLFENYDIKFPEDVKSRPKNLYTPGGYAPDRNQKILMKRRKA